MSRVDHICMAALLFGMALGAGIWLPSHGLVAALLFGYFGLVASFKAWKRRKL